VEGAVLSTLESRGRNPVRMTGARLRNVVRRARRLPDRLRYPQTDEPLRHWQRIVLNDSIRKYLDSLRTDELRGAEISGATHADRRWREYESLMHPQFDLLKTVEDPGGFDVVICEQVLEHVPDPWKAAANLRELVAPGGHVIVSSPFLIRIHELPAYDMRDYWRFTPRGLRTLLEGAGLEVPVVSSWGNRDCIVGNFDRWPAYRWWHSLRDEADLPVQVWAFARRPADG
jgi:SAM-dependent methyltransferase